MEGERGRKILMGSKIAHIAVIVAVVAAIVATVSAARGPALTELGATRQSWFANQIAGILGDRRRTDDAPTLAPRASRSRRRRRVKKVPNPP
jgi:hypothetical protein